MVDFRKNTLKAVCFDRPDFIPVNFYVNESCYHLYDQNWLFDQMESHPLLFPGFVRPGQPYKPVYSNVAQAGRPYKDDFGCVWKTEEDGITGTVVEHPLYDLSRAKNYPWPNPEKCMGIGELDWGAEEERILQEKAAGSLTVRGLRHGHTFLQLCDLCGYENLIYAMMDESEDLGIIIEAIEKFNSFIVKKYNRMGVDIITFAEDLGMQRGPMISPDLFRRYILSVYKRMMQLVDPDRIIHMHSDGDIRLLMDDLLISGVKILNLQDNVNGISFIHDHLKGKCCIELDIDRQFITKRGSPQEIDDYIKFVVDTLGDRSGGLMLIYGLYGGIPMENVQALMDALEKYMFF